jgi:hypothetical protein
MCASPLLMAETPPWQAGIALVKARDRSPGTGFVVAAHSGRAYLLTSAHVVEDDASPDVVFVSDPDGNRLKASVFHREAGDPRGLALLVIDNPPQSIRAIEPGQDLSLAPGASVIVAGFPVVVGRFTVLPASVASIRGRELFLAPETGEGLSGGPVLLGERAVGVVFGREAGFGKALSAASVEPYLRGLGVNWGGRRNPRDGLTYVWIPPGKFMMGCSPGDLECEEDEKPAHEVEITRAFWMGQTEVTQAAWKKVMGTNPSEWKDDQRPVDHVSWFEADKYCKAAGLRLPTEAE